MEGRQGWREGEVVCLLVYICCGYSELKKSLEEMEVKLTKPPAELVSAIHCTGHV